MNTTHRPSQMPPVGARRGSVPHLAPFLLSAILLSATVAAAGTATDPPGGRSNGATSLSAASVMAASAPAGNSYYVATNGSDNWNGMAPAYTGGNAGPFATLHAAARAMHSGDTTYVRGGYYNCTNYTRQYFDPIVSRITLTNYPGETNMFGNQMFLNSCNQLICINGLSQVGIYGINATNCQRTAEFYAATNCTLAYCNLGFANTNYSMNGMVYFANNSVSNIIHDNVLHDHHHDNTTVPQHDMGSTLVLGNLESSAGDATGYNVVTNNLLYHGGHDVLQIQSCYNLIRNNTLHNEPWIWWNDFGQLGGHRCIDVEPRSQGNVIDCNWIGYAGIALGNPAGDGIELCGASNIVRFNAILWCQEGAILFYGDKDGHAANSPLCVANHAYNNTLVDNGLGQQYTTNTTNQVVTDYTANKTVFGMNYATNNYVVNNLFSYNGSNWWARFPSNCIVCIQCTIQDNHWGAQWTNQINGDPLFYYLATNITTLVTNKISETSPYQVMALGSPWDPAFTSFNLRLQSNSPCLGAGQFLTTITSPSGSGTTFTVADAMYFTDGYGMLPGDTIEFQSTGQTAVIQKVRWNSNTITLTSPVNWIQGDGIALPYTGAAPNMGACDVGP